MTMPPEGGACAAEHVRPLAVNDSVHEFPNAAVLADGLCRGCLGVV
jgi:hypothetical protein